jgi:hypothetical protein
MLSRMWGSRWIARSLLVVMLAPAFGPMAQARAKQPNAMHCMRQRVSARTAMPCHHEMAESNAPQPESPPAESSPGESSRGEASPGEASPGEASEVSFRAVDNCCQNHDCCCRIANSEWAQPASSLLSFFSPQIDPAPPSQRVLLPLKDVFAHDSARAPPRG